MGLRATVLVITDELDENLYLSSRNLPNVLVVEARHADPVSLVRFEQRAAHQGGGGQVRGDARMNARQASTTPSA